MKNIYSAGRSRKAYWIAEVDYRRLCSSQLYRLLLDLEDKGVGEIEEAELQKMLANRIVWVVMSN